MGTDGVDSGASAGASFESYISGTNNLPKSDGTKDSSGILDSASTVLEGLGLIGDKTKVEKGETFKDGISSAQGETESDANTVVDDSTVPRVGVSGLFTKTMAELTGGKVTADPGSSEFADQVVGFAQDTLKTSLTIVSATPGMIDGTVSTLTSDQLAALPSFFSPQSPEDKAINGDQNMIGTRAYKESVSKTVIGMASTADDIQNKIGSDAFRALLNDPSAENIAKYPELTQAEQLMVADPTFAAVVNGLDKSADKYVSNTLNNADFIAKLTGADPQNPELESPSKEHTGSTNFNANVTAPGGNEFYAVALTSVLAVFFALLAETQSRVMMMESKNLIASMNRTGALYASAADMILQSAMMQATMYMTQAAMSAVQFVGTAGTLSYMANARVTAEKDVNAEITTLTEKQDTANANLTAIEGRPGIKEKTVERDALNKEDINTMSPENKARYDELKMDADLKDLDRAKTAKNEADYNLLDAQQHKISNISKKANEYFYEQVYINELLKSGTSAIENSVKAAVELMKGQLDSALKLNEGATKINDQTLQSSNKAMGDARDAFRSIMESKERSISALMKAMSINTRG